MDKNNINFGKRFSGAEWADIQKDIMVIGTGGIGTWTIFNLSRIGHNLIIVDPDRVDETNVEGGQLFKRRDIREWKVDAIKNICREFGCNNNIDSMATHFKKGMATAAITITGLDNMTARKDVYNEWKNSIKYYKPEECLLIDGRLTMEMYEIFAIKGTDTASMKKYEEEFLFSDEEANIEDCTTKQTTFAAAAIGAAITATLCNFITNLKLGFEMRELNFYERMFFPMKLLTLEPSTPMEMKEAIVELEQPKTELL